MTENTASPQNDPKGDPAIETPRVIDVLDLLGDGREAILMHNGEAYRLRITANNKLILTK